MRRVIFILLLMSGSVLAQKDLYYTFLDIDLEVGEIAAQIRDPAEKGMSPAEVKKVMGRPKDVILGRPKYEKNRFYIYPADFEFETLFTTWLYYGKKMRPKDLPKDLKMYFLNNIQVPVELFNAYKNRDSVYFLRGGIIVPDENDDLSLSGNLLDREEKFARVFDFSKKNCGFIPVGTVTFDKVTGCVIEHSVYILVSD